MRTQTLSPIDGPSGDGHRDEQEVIDMDGNQRAEDGEAQNAEVDMDADGHAGESQALAPRVARSPREPTSLERQLHEVTHLPMRSWCRHCMMGRSKDVYHAKLGEVDDVPRMGMDYMFVSERGVTSKAEENLENIGDSITMLVLTGINPFGYIPWREKVSPSRSGSRT